ncbi:MAG TPA: cytochrome c maturation protein CcmE [Chitinophagaceae bacterium]|nr:cytochrome c maturation protein CcmE [Chitinophagaceae bacterium]
MKKIHIIILIFIAAAIGVLISFMGDLSTYDTVASANKKEGKFVHLIARLDKSQPIEFDPVKNPNYLSFTAIDTLGNTTKVVYLKGKPTDFEKAERLVLQGAMRNGRFECKDILMKCPSKYKDDPNAAKNNLKTSY